MKLLTKIVAALIILPLANCQKESLPRNDEASFKTFLIPYATGVSIDRQKHEIVIELADYFDWTRIAPVFQVSVGASVYVGGIVQSSAISLNNFNAPITYTVVSESGKPVDWTVRVQSNDSKIGLNGIIEARNRLDRDYDWYFSQDSSGIHSSINGGAAAVAMAMRWTHRTHFVSSSVSQVREEATPQFRPDGTMDPNPQPFSTIDVTGLFTKKDIPWKVISLSTGMEEIIDCINKGYLAICIINMAKVPLNQTATDHTHAFYTTPTSIYPHYLVIKGYKKVSGNLFFECYDPKSDGKKYSNNGEIKGRNRYYSASSLWSGASDGRGWKYSIVVGQKGNAMDPLKSEARMSQITQAIGY
ncbi:hypothetical protein [Desertivirga brevis]|uniref:hypothetical protein n=1 Tax=Desertivirga brevis TaxID=2810310 RepID=UPI001A96FD16|nr:hypothetical protein [Pedobacter sp. SYSU D00873]